MTYGTKNDVVSLIVVAAVSVAINIAYIILIFVPALYILLQRKQQILSLFKLIPKEAVGEIYQQLDTKSKEITTNVTQQRTVCSPNCFILLM